MTGFGRGITKSQLGTIITEIRSVNHRYLDVVVKLPREFQSFEPRIKNRIKKSIHRGRVEVNIEWRGGKSISADINHNIARAYLMNLERLRQNLHLKDSPSLFLLSQMPGVIELRPSLTSAEKVWRKIKEVIDKALGHLLTMREREGRFIEKDIKKSIRIIQRMQKDIERRLSHLPGKDVEEIKNKLGELIKNVDNEKLAAEIMDLSQRVDVNEEVSRFSSHLSQLGIFLNEGKDVGKKISFTIQEMMREANTMAAKANDFSVSRSIIIIKSELEKIKEQAQNIE